VTANHRNGRKKIGRLVSEEDGGLMEAGRTVKGSVSAGWHVPLCVAVFFDNRLRGLIWLMRASWRVSPPLHW